MRFALGFIFAVVCCAAPDFTVRMLHQQGYDKGYGAGDRWDASDLEHEIPPLIDTAAKGGFNMVFLNFEAGWINEADRLLGVNLDSILSKLVQYGKERGVGLLIAVEYAGMEDHAASNEVCRQIRLFQLSGAEARRKVTELRRPLCPIADRDYYLKSVRKALGWHPAGVAISFDDFPATHFEACREAYGSADIRFQGKALGKIASDVATLIWQQAPGTAEYILPRFYGPPYWKSHPKALPDLLATSPATVAVIVTANADDAYLKPLRDRNPARFAFWLNLTSNHMKEKKIWFPGGELDAGQPFDKVRGQPDSKVIVNFGSPPRAQQIAIVMCGRWLESRRNFDAGKALAAAARDVLGSKAAPNAEQYGRLIPFDTMHESLGWVALDHLKDRASLPRQIEKWAEAERAARQAEPLGRALGGEIGRLFALNAERIRRDYAVAQLAGKVALDPTLSNRDALNAAVRNLGQFIQSYPVIPNDAKDAEVVSRGFRFFQDFAADPAKLPVQAPPE